MYFITDLLFLTFCFHRSVYVKDGSGLQCVQGIMCKCSKEKFNDETQLWYKSPFISIYMLFLTYKSWQPL